MTGACLLFFTSEFPYGREETFIENELPVLAQSFQEVFVFPLRSSTGEARDVPENVHIKQLPNSGFTLSLTDRWRCLNLALQDTWSGRQRWNTFRYRFSHVRQLHAKANALEGHIREQTVPFVCYSYWFDEWATILAILRKKGAIQHYVSRAHGFDLYDDRSEFKAAPLRLLQLDTVDMVYAVSQQGKGYLQVKFQEHGSKLTHSYLGTLDHGSNPLDPEQTPHVVSCSSVIPLKRVHYIAHALDGMKNIRWTHFGDGEGWETLNELCRDIQARNPTVQIDLLGRKPNAEVLAFYKSQSVTCFVNVSTTEGLPVSIMEAISFGIPALATNVGGTSEIVNDHTGELLPSTLVVERLREGLTSFIEKASDEAFRTRTRSFWSDHFNALRNYNQFADHIRTFVNKPLES